MDQLQITGADVLLLEVTNGDILQIAWGVSLAVGGGAVNSVNGQTGDVILTAADVGADPAGTATAAIAAALVPYATNIHVASADAVVLLSAQTYANNTTEDLAADINTALAGKADLVDGLVPTSQIPAFAITEFLAAVDNQSEMLALTGQRGDFCIRNDVSMTYVITSNTNTGLLSDWVALPQASSPVASVNGQIGVIVLGPADVGADAAGTAAAIQAGLQSQINTKADANNVIASFSLKVDKTVTVTAGTGLTGGGDLSANRTFTIANTGVTAGTYGTGLKVPQITLNAQGMVTAATEVDITASGGVTITWETPTLSAGYASGFSDTTNPLQIGKSSDGYIYIRGVIRNTSGSTNNNVFLVLPSTHYLKGYTNTSSTQFTLAAPRMQAMGSSLGPFNVGFTIFSTLQQLNPGSALTNTSVWQIPQAVLGIALNP